MSLAVTKGVNQRVFSDYGEVKESSHERWEMPLCDGMESTTRIVRFVLREDISLDRLPHQLWLGAGMVLVVVPGRTLPLPPVPHDRRHIRGIAGP